MSYELPDCLWGSTPDSSVICQRSIDQQKEIPQISMKCNSNYLLPKLSTLFTSLSAPIRGKTLVSFLIRFTRSFGTGELKYTYALQPQIIKTRKAAVRFHTTIQAAKRILGDKKSLTYFLYNGSLPDMSDKNMTMLTRIEKLVISSYILTSHCR